jgi:hypothetical protein
MRALALAALILVEGAHLPARAETSQPEAGAAPDHSGVSLLLNIGQITAFGGGVALGTRAVGVRATAGWLPLLVYSNPDFHFYSGFQVGPDLYARIYSPRPGVDIGAFGGYRYSNLTGHGFAVGGYAQLPLNRELDVNISGGALFFPDGNDHLIQQENLPPGTEFSFPGASFSVGFSVGLAFFP